MSVPVMSNLLSLREPRDRHDHPVSSVRHLATQVVGGGHQAREHRQEPGSPLGRQRQVCQGAQPVDRLSGNGVLWVHHLLFSVGGPTSASGVTRDATDLIEGPTGSLLRVRFHRIRHPHGWAQQRNPPPTVPHRPAPRCAWAPPPRATPHAASAPATPATSTRCVLSSRLIWRRNHETRRASWRGGLDRPEISSRVVACPPELQVPPKWVRQAPPARRFRTKAARSARWAGGICAVAARCSRQYAGRVPGRWFPRISRTRASWARESMAGAIVAEQHHVGQGPERSQPQSNCSREGGSTGCTIPAPQSQVIHTQPQSTPPSSSPQRRCSCTKASRAASQLGHRPTRSPDPPAAGAPAGSSGRGPWRF